MPVRAAALPCAMVLAAACGRSIYDLDAADDAATTSATSSPSTSSTPDSSATSDSPPPPTDLPPPELSCEAQGGRFTVIGGPWTLLSHVLYHSPGYALIPDDDGMLAIVRGEFFGQDPAPNFLGARVTYDGQLLSEVAPVWDTPVLIEPAVHRAAEGSLVTFCGRFGFDDLLASQILDGQGNPLATEIIRNPDGHCGAARPEGVWTGEAYLFSWIDNSSMQVLLDVADSQTNSLGLTELALEGDLSAPPRMAVGPDAVLLVVGVHDEVDEVLAFSLAHDGSILDSYSLALPPDHDVGSLAVGAHPDGSFSVYLAHRDLGLYHSRIDADGQSPSTRIEGATAHFDDLLLLHRPGGLVLVSAAYEDDFVDRIWIIPTDDTGIPTAIEPLEPDPGVYYEAWPAVTMHDGDAWVLYVSAYEDETYDLRLARLGCAR
jgi:hypothetical protein